MEVNELFSSKLGLTRKVEVGEGVNDVAEVPVVQVGMKLEGETGFRFVAESGMVC
jgi:hypothetical protein